MLGRIHTYIVQCHHSKRDWQHRSAAVRARARARARAMARARARAWARGCQIPWASRGVPDS